MEINETLAGYSDLSFESAFAIYVLAFVLLNSRLPEERYGDLLAQQSSAATGAHRLLELHEKYGTDVVVAADRAGVFADWLPFHTWEPRPVAGSAGLVPRSFHPAMEAWGATQFQTRFEKLAARPIREEDYQAWLAVRPCSATAATPSSTAACAASCPSASSTSCGNAASSCSTQVELFCRNVFFSDFLEQVCLRK